MSYFFVGAVSISCVACAGGGNDPREDGAAGGHASVTQAVERVAEISTGDAVIVDKSVAEKLAPNFSVRSGWYTVPTKLQSSGDIFWEEFQEDVDSEEGIRLHNPSVFVQRPDGESVEILDGDPQGIQRSIVGTAHGLGVTVFRETTSTNYFTEDWHIRVVRGDEPPEVLADSEQDDNRPGPRPIPVDMGRNLIVAGDYAVWSSGIPDNSPPPSFDEDADPEGWPEFESPGVEWWVANLNETGQLAKYATRAAFPSTVGDKVYGAESVLPEDGKPGVVKVMAFDPATGNMDLVNDITVAADEHPNSFCANETGYAVALDVGERLNDPTVDDDLTGRVLYFDGSGNAQTIELDFSSPDLTCGDGLLGISKESSREGFQFYYDARNDSLHKLGEHPGFGQVMVAGRNVKWTVPSQTDEPIADYLILRDV